MTLVEFPFGSLPYLIQDHIVKILNPEDLISFSRTSFSSFQRSKRLRKFPLKTLSLNFEGEYPVLEIIGFDSEEPQQVNAEYLSKNIAIIQKLSIKGANPNQCKFSIFLLIVLIPYYKVLISIVMVNNEISQKTSLSKAETAVIKCM